MACFWAYFLRSLNVKPAHVLMPKGMEGAAAMALGLVNGRRAMRWIQKGTKESLELGAEQAKKLAAKLTHTCAHSNTPLEVPDDRVKVYLDMGSCPLHLPADVVHITAPKSYDFTTATVFLLAQLYCQGQDVQWKSICSGASVAIPTYPYENEYSWFESSIKIVEI